MSPKNVDKSDPETVDIEICETSKNTTEKEIADDTSANVNNNCDESTVSF